MARARLIWPEIWSSSQFVSLTPHARLLFIGLWGFCDDAGRHADDPLRVKLEVFPGEVMDLEEVKRLLDEIVGKRLLLRYEVNGESYLQVTGWNKHQKVRYPTYKYPAPDGTVPNSNSREPVKPVVPRKQPQKKRDSKAFVKPTVEEIAAYCKEIDYDLDAQYFFNHYEGNGWMTGNSAMKSWKAVVNNWKERRDQFAAPSKHEKRHEEIVYKS